MLAPLGSFTGPSQSEVSSYCLVIYLAIAAATGTEAL